MINKRRIQWLTVLLVLLTLTGCIQGDAPAPVVEEETKTFIAFTEEAGRAIVLLSPLNASFTYGDLKEEGLEELLYTMEMGTVDEFEEDKATIDNLYNALRSYRRSDLPEEEQMLYDMLKFQLDVTKESFDYLYYANNFNPTFGLQIIMPLTLVQLELETKEEVEGFLARVDLLPDFYDNAIENEYKKAEEALLLQPYLYDLAIEQIDELVTTPEVFLLYQGFEEQIDQADFLTEEEKTTYQQQCLVSIEEKLFPAYDRIKEALSEIRDMSNNELGTSEFENAKGYYEMLIYDKTSYKMSVEELETFIQERGMEKFEAIQNYLVAHPELETMLNDGFEFPIIESVDEALDLSETVMEEKFYDYGVVSAKQKVIPTYLEEHMPGGFYFVTSIDLEDYGNMYLKESYYEEMDINALTTLMHENIPGHHMYFSVLYTTDLPFIQQVSDWDTYSEGFAVYIQNYAMDAVVEDEILQGYFDLFFDLQYLEDMYRDLSVHVYGMSREEYIDGLMMIGYDRDGAEDSYNRMIANPAEVFQYYYSYFKFSDYREAFEESLGEDFDEKAFHDYILKHINIPFSALDEIVDDYLAQKETL